MSKNVELFFEDAKQNNFKDIAFDSCTTIDPDHGRIETRKYTTVSGIDWLQGKENWKQLKTIIMLQSQRDVNDEISEETRYYILEFSKKSSGHFY